MRNSNLQSVAVIYASLETRTVPKPITLFTDSAVHIIYFYYVTGTMRSVVCYYNKFNVYKNKITVGYILIFSIFI